MAVRHFGQNRRIEKLGAANTNLVYGYAIEYKYGGDGNLYIKTRIPMVHGPLNQKDYRGQHVRRYVSDADLPYYPSILLPHLPNYGEVVALMSRDPDVSGFIVIGIMGGSYIDSQTNNLGI